MPRLRPSPCLAALALTAAACQPAPPRYGRADIPPSAPVPLPGLVAKVDRSARSTSGLSPEEAAQCGPYTGRNPDGDCVSLGLWDTEHVQRVQIPAGRFVMGHVPAAYDAQPARERPAARWPGQPPRHVDLPSFWIDLHEVSRGAYQSCVAAGACAPAICPEGQPDPAAALTPEIAAALPQTCVTHAQAAAYCASQQGRLPSEAEWEYAARGPDARVYPWGNKVIDELQPGLYPVGRLADDRSYFGIRGLGTNALEWVADRYDPDVGLRPYLSGEFRDPAGPLLRARAAHEARLACGDPPARGCAPPRDPPPRYRVKVSLAGAHRAARAELPPHPAPELEGWDELAHGPKIGFRCAADLVPGRDTPLTLPAGAAPIPITRAEAGLQLFGGVAEAVNRAEARRFCERLAVPVGDGPPLTGFRLPTLAEVQAIAAVFRGPGPFWTADAAALQDDGTSRPAPDAPWVALAVADDDALAARCVR